jgi:hypothetical protein
VKISGLPREVKSFTRAHRVRLKAFYAVQLPLNPPHEPVSSAFLPSIRCQCFIVEDENEDEDD